MFPNQNCEVFLLILLQHLRRKRNTLIRSLLTCHEETLKKMAHQRRKVLRQVRATQGEIPFNFLARNVPRLRQFHKRPRCPSYWWTLQQPENESLYFESFRMTANSFNVLCKKLEPYLETSENFFTEPMPIKVQGGICLYKLASACEYRVVGDVFGVHKSTVCKYFHKIVTALLKLKNEFIKFPQFDEAILIAKEFEKRCKIPNIIGAIDGMHIPILPPSDGHLDFINRKGWASIVMQAVVDDKYLFRDVSVKLPGSTHNATVFKESGLYKNSSQLIPQNAIRIDGVGTTLMLVGDPAYPLLPWLMKPYTGSLSCEEEPFNCYLSSGRMVVENAFGRLKGRWRCLLKRIDVDPKFVPSIVLACTILHNYVETRKEAFVDSWSQAVGSEFQFQQPRGSYSFEIINEDRVDPKIVRDHLKTYLAQSFPLRKSHI